MDPGLITGFTQFANSEMARGDVRNQRKRIEDLIDNLQDPNYDLKALTPEDYKLAQQYAPEAARYIEEQAPQVVTESADMAAGRRAQRDALEKLSSIGNDYGMDPQLAAMANDAARKAQIGAQSRQASILQDAARRGNLNSGSTLAAQLMGASEGMDRAAQTQSQLAADAYRQRLDALSKGAELGGQIRSQDINLQGKNADVINAFNQRNSANRQAMENMNVGNRNEAQRMNVANIQDIANKNVSNRNNYQQYNQKRGDELENARYNAQLGKINLQAGQAANNIGDIRQNAADRNQAIQGVGNIFTNQQMNDRADQLEEQRQNRADRRAQYNKTGEWGE